MGLDFGLVAEQMPAILAGLWVTVWIWIAATILGMMLGFVVAILRKYGPTPFALVLRFVVEVLRGTPFLVQLFLLYFGGPSIGLRLEPIPAGLIGLTVYGAAYYSEIFRAGFNGVPVGHVEAAASVGLTRAQLIRRIVVPEMAMLVLPQLVNMIILMMKETAVLSIVTVPEMTATISAIGSQQYAFVEAMFLLALFYWVIVEVSGRLGRIAEARLARFRF